MQNFIFLQRKSPGVLQQMSGDFLFNKFLASKYVIISPMREHKKFLKKDICITAGILGIASLVALLLQRFGSTDTHVPLLFVLAVLFVSRFTQGYVCGIVASMIAVVEVNYIFTYPYFEINFTLTGYPLTFVAMLAVSVSVGTLTTQIKQQEQIRLEAEKEKMRGNLLRAVSHDIRTPLTSIVGSASGILDNQQLLSKERMLELIQDVKDEAQWLIRIVENLLSVTRINGENAQIHTDDEIVEEIIGSAVLKFRKRFPQMSVEVVIPTEFLMVPMDEILIEQVIFNLLENSVLHGKTTKNIQIVVNKYANRLIIAIEDDGEDANLTQNEYKIVSLLGKYGGKVLTYDFIIKEIWGPNMKTDNRILRVNMANIRRKIEKNPAQPQYIFTEVGVGYRIVEPE